MNVDGLDLIIIAFIAGLAIDGVVNAWKVLETRRAFFKMINNLVADKENALAREMLEAYIAENPDDMLRWVKHFDKKKEEKDGSEN